MIGGGSDAESSDEGMAPRARIVHAKPREQVLRIPKGRRGRRSVQDCVEAGLLNYSSEDEVPPTATSSAGGMEENASQRDTQAADGEPADTATQNSTGSSAPAAAPAALSNAEKIQAMRERNKGRKRKTGNDADTEDTDFKLFLRSVKEHEKKKQAENRTVKRRDPEEVRLKKGGKTKVILEKAEGEEDGTPEKSSDGPTPMKEARHRLRGPGGKGGGKGKGRKGGDSDSEGSMDDSTKQAWEEDLNSRRDRGSQKLATAFSIKPCPGAAIRTLGPDSFLGGRRLEEGGHLLFDTQGKVNVHFLLGTHKMAQKVKEKRERGDETIDKLDSGDAAYLKWLLVKALELRAVSKGESKRGVVNKSRVQVAQKTCRWSLAYSTNLAQHSGDEKDDDDGTPELKFKVQSRSDVTKTDNKECRQLFRSQVAEKQAKITVTSNHNADLEKVQDMLTAPSFSFDWEAKGDDEEDGLEVDIPDEEKTTSSRDLLRDALRRSVSFNQAKKLSWRERGKSGSMESLTGASRSHSVPSDLSAAGDVDMPSNTAEEALSGAVGSQNGTASSTESQRPSAAAADAAAKDAAAVKEDEMEVARADAVKVQVLETAEDVSLGHETEAQAAAAAAAKEPPAPARASPAADEAMEVEESAPLSHAPPAARQLLAQLEGVSCDAPPADMPDDLVADQPKAPSMQGAAEHSSRSHGSEAPSSQDWHGITPTAMWSCSEKSDAHSEAVAAAGDPDALQGGRRSVEISPTLPFVPSKIANDNPKQHVEISPTLPFVPNAHAAVEAQKPAEISPTLPFHPVEQPQKQPVEISPTLPMEPRVQQLNTGLAEDALELEAPGKENQNLANMATNASVSSDEGKTLKDMDLPEKPDDEYGVPKSGMKRLRERSLIESDDSPSEDSALEAFDMENPEGLSQAEMVLQQDAKQRQQERQWLKHKRKAARREEREKLRREMATAKARKRGEDLAQAPWLGTASGTLSKAALPDQSIGLTRLVGGESGSDLLSEFGSALQRKKSFLRR